MELDEVGVVDRGEDQDLVAERLHREGFAVLGVGGGGAVVVVEELHGEELAVGELA